MPARGAFAAVLALLAGAAPAVPQLEVQALFPDRALLLVDGAQRLLRVGERSPEGVLLRAADTAGADVEVDGRRLRLVPGGRAGGAFGPAPATRVWIVRAADGMYRADGRINGRPVNFMVDTGASSVALSATQAEALGVRYRRPDRAGPVQTAAGVVTGYQVKLAEVRIGALRLTQVDAIVLDGPHPPQPLLGMSFLRRTRMRNEAGALVLETLSP